MIGGELIVLKKGGEHPRSGVHAGRGARARAHTETVFLGLLDGAARFGIGIAPANAEALKARNDLFVIDLRSIAIQGLVAADHLPPLAEAKAMLHWHARHRFCSNCGAATDLVEAGWKRACPACKVEHFPRTDPVVIMLAVRGDKGLLGRSGRFAATMWSCLAGFVEPGESVEDAVRRETLEEAGIKCGRVKYLFTQPWPFPMSLMIGCHAEALNDDITMDVERAGGRALVQQGRMGRDADAQASRRADHAAAGRHRPPHHPRMGGERPCHLLARQAASAVRRHRGAGHRVPGRRSSPRPAARCMTNEFIIVSGGCAVNAAIAVARLGGRAHYAGPLGDPNDQVSNQLMAADGARRRSTPRAWCASRARPHRCRASWSTPPASG